MKKKKIDDRKRNKRYCILRTKIIRKDRKRTEIKDKERKTDEIAGNI